MNWQYNCIFFLFEPWGLYLLDPHVLECAPRQGWMGRERVLLIMVEIQIFFILRFIYLSPFWHFATISAMEIYFGGKLSLPLWVPEEEAGLAEFSSLVLSSGLWPCSLFWQLSANLINCKESFCVWIFIAHSCFCQLNQNKDGLKLAPCTLPCILGT